MLADFFDNLNIVRNGYCSFSVVGASVFFARVVVVRVVFVVLEFFVVLEAVFVPDIHKECLSWFIG